ncbi:MAG: anaerobic ribonucleoside-triphosphate reductase activating protein [Candidatus Glassbacteria bacterium]|nr:anaerobic ribonucleoside-triphosphate reductase activating protein [Candidatus Glassbacteria bacterium]
MEQQTVQNRIEQTGEDLSPVYALLKKPSLIDYPGRMCRVMFISGCNMRCFFCHNTVLAEPQKNFIAWSRLEQTLLASRVQWVDSVCISGGEPTLHPQLLDLISRVRDLGFRVKLDTNGSMPEILSSALTQVDYVAMDYKAPLARYAEISGCRTLERNKIVESVKLITESGVDYEFRTTIVEDWHREEDMHAIGRELSGARRYRIQGYVPPRHGEGPVNGRPLKRTSMKTLKRYEKISREYFPETFIRGG